jgi:hypothetical protein
MYPVAPVSRCMSRPYFGKRTVSITWITPLEASMSVLITCALFTITPPITLMVRPWPSAVLAESSLHYLLRRHPARHHVIQKNAPQLSLVLRLEQGFQRAGRQLGKGFVSRREHRERSGTFQRVHQTRGFHRGHQSVELSSDSHIHDVGRGSDGCSQAVSARAPASKVGK